MQVLIYVFIGICLGTCGYIVLSKVIEDEDDI